jgi:hypothetical protein
MQNSKKLLEEKEFKKQILLEEMEFQNKDSNSFKVNNDKDSDEDSNDDFN